jgi:hypothetical protein
MKLIEEDNFDKQLIPLLEPIIAQSLDMMEKIIDSGENFSRDEVSSLFLDLEENFGEYKHLLSPKIYGRIMNINYRLSQLDEGYDFIEEVEE